MIKLKSSGHEKSEDFTIEYSNPLKIKKVALQSFSMEVSWYNLSKKYNNNKFSIISDYGDMEIITSDGNYTVRGLNEYLIKLFKDHTVKLFKDLSVKFGIIEARREYLLSYQKVVKLIWGKENFTNL